MTHRLRLEPTTHQIAESYKILYSKLMIEPLPTTVNAAEARANLANLLEGCDRGEPEVVITRHGKAVAVLLGAERYKELIATLEALEEALLAERAQARMRRITTGEEITLSFEEVFGEPQAGERQ